MKALLIKDFHIIKLFFVLILLFSFATGISLKNGAGSTGIVGVMYVLLMPNILMNQDEYTKFSRLASMMPFSNTDMVLEKYVVALIGLAVSVLSSGLGIVVSSLLNGTGLSVSSFAFILGEILLVLVYLAVSMPLNFRVTTQVGRTVTMIVSMLLVALLIGVGVVVVSISNVSLTDFPAWVYVAAGVVSLALFAGSILLSVHIYRNRDK